MSAVTVRVSGVKQAFFYHLHCKPCVILYSDPLSRMHLISVGMFSLFSAVAQTPGSVDTGCGRDVDLYVKVLTDSFSVLNS